MDDQRVLSIIENFGTVTMCSGGVVHVNLPYCSLKFLPSDFNKFAELVLKANNNLEHSRKPGKPKLQLVSDEDRSSSDGDKSEVPE
jgi:hypothetical protein